jgi:ADP-ribosylation factor GTPase-activating protein 2/3
MKVGGNASAHEFFRQHGLGESKDAKTKYSSRPAALYKEKLAQKCAEDARK